MSESAIDYAVWPSNLQQAIIETNLLKTGLTGETRLQSRDGCAWAELAAHGQTLTVCYLARLSRHGSRVTSSSGALERNGLELSRPELHMTDGEQENEVGR